MLLIIFIKTINKIRSFRKKISVINNPLNTKKSPVRIKENNVIYAGRLSKEKGLIELIDAWLEADIKDFNLIIIGDGDLKKNLSKIF